MWRYLGLAAAVHAVWIGLFLVVFTLTVPLDHPWWEEDVRAAVLVFGLCVQAFLLPVLGLAVMLWPERGRGLGPRASAHRVTELVYGLELRRRWPWTLSGYLLILLGLGGLGAMGLVFMFTAHFQPVDRSDVVDRGSCPEGV